MSNWLVNTPFGIKKTGKSGYFFHHHHDPLGILFPLDNILHLCQLVDRERSAEGVFMELDQVVTFSSFVDSTGRVYQPIDHAELGTS